MALKIFRAAFKSQEDRGGGQPNIVTFGWDSSDVEGAQSWVTDTLAPLIAGDLMSIWEELGSNFTQPYPAGSQDTVRIVMRTELGGLDTQWLYDFDGTKSPTALGAALLALGMEHRFNGESITSVQVVPTDLTTITPV